MAAEEIASAGHHVSVYDAMPSVGRKFLLAGVGGMNITHAEPAEDFRARYSANSQFINTLKQFDSLALRHWVHGLGIETFVGTSGRVFPADMKAAPLLRAWLHRLRELGVKIYPRHRWLGFENNNELIYYYFYSTSSRAGDRKCTPAATIAAIIVLFFCAKNTHTHIYKL